PRGHGLWARARGVWRDSVDRHASSAQQTRSQAAIDREKERHRGSQRVSPEASVQCEESIAGGLAYRDAWAPRTKWRRKPFQRSDQQTSLQLAEQSRR